MKLSYNFWKSEGLISLAYNRLTIHTKQAYNWSCVEQKIWSSWTNGETKKSRNGADFEAIEAIYRFRFWRATVGVQVPPPAPIMAR
ncbi:hypothetical protein CVV65_07560 [Kyrpidia spormannii]|uniref:Uncharacterized protein n=1 Tax=Kyrpidia spormannii TaxID=2055160 RepID=A0A2K8N7K7_9BACL|nr:hypothetical protein CVV65_07560 [Kyrpidia spormannii]